MEPLMEKSYRHDEMPVLLYILHCRIWQYCEYSGDVRGGPPGGKGGGWPGSHSALPHTPLGCPARDTVPDTWGWPDGGGGSPGVHPSSD